MKKVALITCCIFILITAGYANADYHKKMKGQHHSNEWRNRSDIAQTLNLSNEQTEKFRAIRTKNFEQTKEIRTEIYNKNAELSILWNQISPDAQTIKNKTNEICELQKQLNEISVDFRLEFRNILTPEQLNRCLAENKCGFGMGMGMGNGMGFFKHRNFR